MLCISKHINISHSVCDLYNLTHRGNTKYTRSTMNTRYKQAIMCALQEKK